MHYLGLVWVHEEWDMHMVSAAGVSSLLCLYYEARMPSRPGSPCGWQVLTQQLPEAAERSDW